MSDKRYFILFKCKIDNLLTLLLMKNSFHDVSGKTLIMLSRGVSDNSLAHMMRVPHIGRNENT